MLRSWNKPIPMTSHTTCSAGSFRRRTDAVPVAAKAAAIHCGSIAALNCSKLAGRSPAPTARMASPTSIAPPPVGRPLTTLWTKDPEPGHLRVNRPALPLKRLSAEDADDRRDDRHGLCAPEQIEGHGWSPLRQMQRRPEASPPPAWECARDNDASSLGRRPPGR